MEYKELSLIELVNGLQSGAFSSVEVTRYFLERIDKYKKYNAVLEVFEDSIAQAETMDKRIKSGFKGKLAGVPVLIKDNILFKGHHASCASKFLENFIAPYNATVVDKMLAEGAVIIGRTNMDEFATGSSTEHSAYGICHNAVNFDYVPGGSSGGSASAVALGLCPVALGTDTGGSIRQPSSFNGVVGVKPTYGRISRYGVVAYASSLEQVGPITKNVEDNAYMLEILAGRSENDETSLKANIGNYLNSINSKKFKTIGVIKEINEIVKGLEVEKVYLKTIDKLKKRGFVIKEVSLPDFKTSLSCYYVIASAELASNLGRFDGVKFTTRSQNAKDIYDIYKMSRTEGFGQEIKRRIMLGNFVLSSGYFDAYYNKAKLVQQKLKKQADRCLESCDALLYPTTVGGAFKLGENLGDTIKMYKEDLFTTLANILGLPSISVPVCTNENGLPIGLQIMADTLCEEKMYSVAKAVEEIRG